MRNEADLTDDGDIKRQVKHSIRAVVPGSNIYSCRPAVLYLGWILRLRMNQVCLCLQLVNSYFVSRIRKSWFSLDGTALVIISLSFRVCVDLYVSYCYHNV